MPKNNELKAVKLPMEVKFDKGTSTEFVNNLDAIKVELVSSPTMNELCNYLPGFAEATWNPDVTSSDNLSREQRIRIVRNVFKGKTLPTALETINLVFRVSGISLQEVTHLIRYRNASFSADCSGDKWWNDKDALVPNSIQNSNGEGGDDFYSRYTDIVIKAKQLYADMIDSRQISIMDARYILPRCLSTFYYYRMSLKDALHFIKQRIDKQIQPETDNVIAYQMYLEILKRYPVANGLVNIHAPSGFYINMARTGKATNLYFPDADSDKFDWNENDFIYQCYRDEMNGTDKNATNHFNEVLRDVEGIIEELEKDNNAWIDSMGIDRGSDWE